MSSSKRGAFSVKGAWPPLKDSHALEIEPSPVSTKIDMLAFAVNFHPVSNIFSIGTL